MSDPDTSELSSEEALAAFVAAVNILDAAGFSPGFGRITKNTPHGVDITFTLFNRIARKNAAAWPDALEQARIMLEHDEGSAG